MKVFENLLSLFASTLSEEQPLLLSSFIYEPDIGSYENTGGSGENVLVTSRVESFWLDFLETLSKLRCFISSMLDTFSLTVFTECTDF